MKKMFFEIIALSLIISACGSVASQPTAIQAPPVSEANLRATAAVLSQQTLQASLPTPTLAPSATPVALTATKTSTPAQQGTLTETPNSILLTLTATLGTGTPPASVPTNTLPFVTNTLPFATNVLPFVTNTLPFATFQFSTATPSVNNTPAPISSPLEWNVTPLEPSGKIKIVNKSNSKTSIPYISLHCTRKDGTTAYLEYSVENKITAKAPVGSYYYVAFVNGKKFTGSFKVVEGGGATIVISANGVTAQ